MTSAQHALLAAAAWAFLWRGFDRATFLVHAPDREVAAAFALAVLIATAAGSAAAIVAGRTAWSPWRALALDAATFAAAGWAVALLSLGGWPRDLGGVVAVLVIVVRLAPGAFAVVSGRAPAWLALPVAFGGYAALAAWLPVASLPLGDQIHYLLVADRLGHGSVDATIDGGLFMSILGIPLSPEDAATHVAAAPTGPRPVQGYGLPLLILPGWVLAGRLGAGLMIAAFAAWTSFQMLLILRDVGGALPPLRPLRPVVGPSQHLVRPPRDVVGPSRNVVGPSRNVVGPSRNVVGPSRNVVGPSRNVVGPSLNVVGWTWLIASAFAPMSLLATHVYPNVIGAAIVATGYRAGFTAPVRRPALAAAVLALALFLTPRDAVPLVVLLPFLLRDRAIRPRVAMAAAAILAVAAIANAVLYGLPLPYAGYVFGTGQAQDITHQGSITLAVWVTLPAILFDRTFGIAGSAPWAFIGLLGLAPALRADRREAHARLLPAALAVGASVLVLSFFRLWEGGYAPPARYFVDVLPLWAPFVAWGLALARGAVLRAALGLLVALSALTALVLNAVPSLALNTAFDDKIRNALGRALGIDPLAWLPSFQPVFDRWYVVAYPLLLIAVVGAVVLVVIGERSSRSITARARAFEGVRSVEGVGPLVEGSGGGGSFDGPWLANLAEPAARVPAANAPGSPYRPGTTSYQIGTELPGSTEKGTLDARPGASGALRGTPGTPHQIDASPHQIDAKTQVSAADTAGAGTTVAAGRGASVAAGRGASVAAGRGASVASGRGASVSAIRAQTSFGAFGSASTASGLALFLVVNAVAIGVVLVAALQPWVAAGTDPVPESLFRKWLPLSLALAALATALVARAIRSERGAEPAERRGALLERHFLLYLVPLALMLVAQFGGAAVLNGQLGAIYLLLALGFVVNTVAGLWWGVDGLTDRAAALHLAAVALVAMVVLLPYHRSVMPTASDEPHYLIVTQSLVYDHDLNVRNDYEGDRYMAFYPSRLPDVHAVEVGDALYSIRDLGMPLLATVPFAIAGRLGVLALMCLVGAALVAQLYRLLRDLRFAPRVALLATASTALVHPALTYTTQVYPELLTALAFVTAARVLRRGAASTLAQLALASALVGALPWLSTRAWPIAVGVGLVVAYAALASPGDRARRTLAGAVPFGALVVALSYVNWRTFGLFLPSAGYFLIREQQPVLTYTPWIGIPGLLFDRVFGLVPRAPVFLLAFVGIVPLLRRARTAGVELAALALGGVLSFVYVADIAYWWADGSPPSRYLLGSLPLLVAAVAAGWEVAAARWARVATALAVVTSAGVVYLYAVLPNIRYDLALDIQATGSSGALFAFVDRAAGVDPGLLFPSLVRSDAASVAIATLWIAIALVLAAAGRRTVAR